MRCTNTIIELICSALLLRRATDAIDKDGKDKLSKACSQQAARNLKAAGMTKK